MVHVLKVSSLLKSSSPAALVVLFPSLSPKCHQSWSVQQLWQLWTDHQTNSFISAWLDFSQHKAEENLLELYTRLSSFNLSFARKQSSEIFPRPSLLIRPLLVRSSSRAERGVTTDRWDLWDYGWFKHYTISHSRLLPSPPLLLPDITFVLTLHHHHHHHRDHTPHTSHVFSFNYRCIQSALSVGEGRRNG